MHRNMTQVKAGQGRVGQGRAWEGSMHQRVALSRHYAKWHICGVVFLSLMPKVIAASRSKLSAPTSCQQKIASIHDTKSTVTRSFTLRAMETFLGMSPKELRCKFEFVSRLPRNYKSKFCLLWLSLGIIANIAFLGSAMSKAALP